MATEATTFDSFSSESICTNMRMSRFYTTSYHARFHPAPIIFQTRRQWSTTFSTLNGLACSSRPPPAPNPSGKYLLNRSAKCMQRRQQHTASSPSRRLAATTAAVAAASVSSASSSAPPQLKMNSRASAGASAASPSGRGNPNNNNWASNDNREGMCAVWFDNVRGGGMGGETSGGGKGVLWGGGGAGAGEGSGCSAVLSGRDGKEGAPGGMSVLRRDLAVN